MLRKLDEGLWVAEHPLRLAGSEFGTRVTVVRLPDGGLWLHCPIPLGEGLREQIQAQGAVRYLVAPNKLHYFWLAENAQAFPDARLHLAPGLAEKRPELPEGEVLDETTAPWSGEIDQAFIGGWPFANETVFLHRATRTAILTDIAFNLRAPRPFLERVALSLLGAYDRFGPSRLARVTMRDKAKIRAGLDRVLAWDFDRVIVGHGDVVESGGRELLRDAYAFVP